MQSFGTIVPGAGIGTLRATSVDLSGALEVEYRAPGAGAPLVTTGTGQSLRGRNTLLDPGLAPADQDADLLLVSGAALIEPTARLVLRPQGTDASFEAALAAPGNTDGALRYQILRATGGETGSFVALSESGSTIEYVDAGGGARDIWLVLRGLDTPVLVGAAPAPYVMPRATVRPLCDGSVAEGAWCVVVQGTYASLDVGSAGSAPGTDGDTTGGLLGFGYGLGDGMQVGLALTAGSGELDLSDGSGSADSSTTGGLI